MERRVQIIGCIVFIGVILSPFVFYPHKTEPSLHHHNSRVPVILSYDYDLCGELNGGDSSCNQLLNRIGIQYGMF
jgi:hypothetical protein